MPGATESLLMATAQTRRSRPVPLRAYESLSVLIDDKGAIRVHRLHIDQSSNRVVTELLDVIPPHHGGLTPAEIIRHWAHEIVLRDIERDFG